MKTNILFLCFLTALKMVYTQDFGSNDARWVYNYDGTWSYGVTIMQYEKDSIIAGIPTKIYKKEGIRIIRRDSSIIKFALRPIYIRTINGIVTTSENAVYFDTLYNYKAEKGRSWDYTTSGLINYGIDTITMTIWDTFRVNVSGQELFAQAVRFNNKNFTDYVDTVYDIIGSKRHYIIPFDEVSVAVDGGEGGFLRCFSSSEVRNAEFNNGDIQNRYIYDCTNLTSSETEMEHKYEIRIIENPFKDILTFINLTSRKQQFKVFNLQGTTLFTGECKQGVNQVDLMNENSGQYILLFESGEIYKVIKK